MIELCPLNEISLSYTRYYEYLYYSQNVSCLFEIQKFGIRRLYFNLIELKELGSRRVKISPVTEIIEIGKINC